MKRLLVAYDSSDQSNAALDLALALARSEGATVTAAYAMHLAEEIGRIAAAFHHTPSSAAKMLRDDARAILEDASTRAAAAGVKIGTKLVDAPVISGLVDYAKRIRADTIVVGSHGRSGLPRLLLGSVAEGLMRHSDVPVLVVRLPAAARKSGKRRNAKR